MIWQYILMEIGVVSIINIGRETNIPTDTFDILK